MKETFAVTLVHFLWQGAVLALAGWTLMRIARTPTLRYAIGVLTMAAMLAAPILTFGTLRAVEPVVAVAGLVGQLAAPADATGGNPVAGSAGSDVSSGSPIRGYVVPTTLVLSLWTLGVAVLSLRFVGGLTMAHRLATRALEPVGDDLQRLAVQLATRLGVRGVVRVCQSASVAVPVMIGWLRPVIVLPPFALAALPLSQLEALLAHEFAHIRRHDYLVNLLQTAVETLCFYHPAVWWMSAQVRMEREHCCDDLAVGVCDRLTYVTALSTLASFSSPARAQFALAAAGGSLRDRIRRLIDSPSH